MTRPKPSVTTVASLNISGMSVESPTTKNQRRGKVPNSGEQEDLGDHRMRWMTNLNLDRKKFYNFSVKWVPGKTHYIADALSRVPVFSTAKLEEDQRDIEDMIHCIRISSDPALNIITETAKDNAYTEADTERLQTGEHATPAESSPLHEYANVLNTLSIAEPERGTLLIMKDMAKIVIPKPARSKISELHRAHSGISKTYKAARQLYYWRHMKNDIEQAKAACSLCQAERPTQA